MVVFILDARSAHDHNSRSTHYMQGIPENERESTAAVEPKRRIRVLEFEF